MILPERSEGAVALYLIEGIRNGWREPARNPSLHHPVPGRAQQLAAQAYRRWWQTARDLPRDRAAAIDPLRGTRVSWQ